MISNNTWSNNHDSKNFSSTIPRSIFQAFQINRWKTICLFRMCDIIVSMYAKLLNIWTMKTYRTIDQYCSKWSTLEYFSILPHITIFRLTISVNFDHTICSMQSDSYSPTDHLTTENTSNRHSILCYSLHSTTLHTSTPSHYPPTNPIGQHWPYHM